ncbi:Uncharacterised protein [Serratia proteamaculans]|uniref:hypothetical protein n=1 Tax=Serratia proteamaculans TaxID=28151 RepID=UPI00217A6131|nr:hypothetical protein [Serratia proteamaculans]CAI1576242.1 Uncharacterised protein [Serratia proteamaculans]
MAIKQKEGAADEAAESISVVVLKGKHICHSGKEHKQNTRVVLPKEDAERLIKLGFVKTYEVLLEEADQANAETGTTVTTEGQTSITAVKTTDGEGA